MRGIALEIPLGALALVGRRKRGDAADARVEPLGDALDRAALAGRVAPFEQHDDLEALVLDPRLQADQLMLELEQLAKIDAAMKRLGRPLAVGKPLAKRLEAAVFQLHLQLFVEIIREFLAKAVKVGGVCRHADRLGRRYVEPVTARDEIGSGTVG